MKSFRDRFSPRAADYARSRPTYPAGLVDWLVGISRAHTLAWDSGCGSGQLTVPLARGFDRVVGSDASAVQLAAAPAHPRVRYRVARSERSGLPDRSVDLAVAAQSAHWFDLDAYYAEVRRVGRPGSAIALVTYGRPELTGDAGRLLGRFHAEVLGPFWPPERRHVDAGYRSLPFPFEELTPPAFVMRHRWDLERFRGYVGTWSAIHNLEHRQGPGPLRQFFLELERAWGEAGARREVRWPIALRVGRL